MADPISIVSAVGGIAATCLKASIALSTLASKYTKAAVTLTSLSSECAIVSTALNVLQALLVRNARIQSRADILSTFDTALTGCMVVLSCLEREVGKVMGGEQRQARITWRMKTRLLWSEDSMKEYLSQLRGQHSSLSFLVQMLQLESLDEMHEAVVEDPAVVEKPAADANSLRALNPDVHIPESILGIRRSAETIFGDAGSTIGGMEFAFDDSVVNSKAYRRAMAMAQAAVSKQDLAEKTTSMTDIRNMPEEGVKSPEPVSKPIMEPLTSWYPSLAILPLQIDRPKMVFNRPLTREISLQVQVQNPNPGMVAFHVQTTNPKGYYVRPSWGVIPANGRALVLFVKAPMQEDPPPDHVCEDKFKIRSVAVHEGEKYESGDRIREKIDELTKNAETTHFAQSKRILVDYAPPDETQAVAWF